MNLACHTTLALLFVLLLPSLSATPIRQGFLTDPDGTRWAYAVMIPAQMPAGTVLTYYPLETQRWNPAAWCAALRSLSDTKRLILVCIDAYASTGGRLPGEHLVGQRSNQILDSVFRWYRSNHHPVWTLGVSFGAQYALMATRSIRTPVSGVLMVSPTLETLSSRQSGLTSGLACYIIHGAQDMTERRYFELQQQLMAQGLCTSGQLLPHRGHMTDPVDFVAACHEGITWLQSTKCLPRAGTAPSHVLHVRISGHEVWMQPQDGSDIRKVWVYDENQILVRTIQPYQPTNPIIMDRPGWYRISAETDTGVQSQTIEITTR